MKQFNDLTKEQKEELKKSLKLYETSLHKIITPKEEKNLIKRLEN